VVGFYDHTIGPAQSKGKFNQPTCVQFGIAPGEVVLVKAPTPTSLKDPRTGRAQALGVTGLARRRISSTRALAAKAGLKSGLFAACRSAPGDTFWTAMQQGKTSPA